MRQAQVVPFRPSALPGIGAPPAGGVNQGWSDPASK